jgi:hypothetical protein
MRLLPVLIAAKPLTDSCRRKRHPAVGSGAFKRRPHLELPLSLGLPLTLALQAPVALFNPDGLGTWPSLRPKLEETEAGLAIDPDSHHFNRNVARTDEVGGRHTARRRGV